MVRILDPKLAQAFVVESQLLATSVGKGEAALLPIFHQLGYLQIDTISVVERAHHHILWSRISDYHPLMLQKIEEEKRQVFEYWAHAASYLPMRDYP